MAATLDRRGLQLAACLNVGSIRRDPHAPGATVEVWRADLDAVAGELVELLSPEEHARAGRMARAEDRARWMRARGALRALLGSYLESEPRALSFATGPHGKPALSGRGGLLPDRERLNFNMSHSGGVAVYALTRGAAVGVDVEVLDRDSRRDDVALAERAFGPDTAGRLRTLQPAARRREFLREWVRHEAALKCLGVGLAGTGRLAEAGPPEPWVCELDVGPGAVAAVAVQVEPDQPG